jgi:hypothetical protein
MIKDQEKYNNNNYNYKAKMMKKEKQKYYINSYYKIWINKNINLL